MNKLKMLKLLIKESSKDEEILINNEDIINKTLKELTDNWDKLSNNDLMLLNYLIIKYNNIKNKYKVKTR